MRRNLNLKKKQAAVFLFCGLLSPLAWAQQRDTQELKDICSKFEKTHIAARASEAMGAMTLATTSSSLYPQKRLTPENEAFYIYSDPRAQGFLIVSGDKRMPVILGYSDSNGFDTDHIPDNVRYWLECYAKDYLALDSTAHPGRTIEATTIEPEGVAPLLGSIQWGQESPYNNRCPSDGMQQCVTGCVATAMAQVMKYYTYPQKGHGVKSYTIKGQRTPIAEDLSGIVFDWENMLDNYKTRYTNTQGEAVANLMYSCGVAVEMVYSPESSGAFQTDLLAAFVENFDYDENAAIIIRDGCSTEEWHQLLIQELNAGRPVNFAGFDEEGGHSFVIDGYRPSEETLYPSYHVNWGWEGTCDGYYQMSSMRPRDAAQRISSSSGYTDGQQMTIGIMPEDGVDNHTFHLCTNGLQTSKKNLRQGGHTRLYTSECLNTSYKAFKGSIEAIMVNDEGDEFAIAEKRISSLKYLDHIDNFFIDATIPEDIANGEYTIKLIAKAEGTEKSSPVHSASYSRIAVSQDNEIPDNEEIPASIVCSEMELAGSEESSIIGINMYEVLNLQAEPFVGTIRMLLTDNKGKILTIFGDSIVPEEMGYNEVQKEHWHLQGSLDEHWPDGLYRLYIGAKHITSGQYSFVKKYDWITPGATPTDFYYNVQLKGEEIIIDGHTFRYPTDNISFPFAPDNNWVSVHNLHGVFYGCHQISALPTLKYSIPQGIYLIRDAKGNVTKHLIQ